MHTIALLGFIFPPHLQTHVVVISAIDTLQSISQNHKGGGGAMGDLAVANALDAGGAVFDASGHAGYVVWMVGWQVGGVVAPVGQG